MDVRKNEISFGNQNILHGGEYKEFIKYINILLLLHAFCN
jgi:hypothetical protein